MIDVLANDTDPNSGGVLNPGSVFVVAGPSHGSTKLDTSTGDITYTPDPGYAGLDHFSYTATDNFGQTSNAATVTILVNPPVYNRPVANDDLASTPGNKLVVIDVLANDTDPNLYGVLEPSSVFVVSPPSDGSTSLNPSTGAITYTPKSGFTGTDKFEYTVSDNFGLTSLPATVTVVVTASPPVAQAITVVTPVNTPVLIDILANVTDPNPAGELNPASVKVVPGSGPSDGPQPSLNTTTGALTYTPNPGFTGTDTFMYTVTDNFGLTSIPALATIEVTSAITASGMRFNLYPELPLNNVPIATFTDANLNTPPAVPTTYMASINWGDGLTSSGAVSGPDSNGVFTVTSSFDYPSAFTSQLVTGSALPVTITITDSEGDTATANSSAILVTAGQTVAFTGGLAPIQSNGSQSANGVTDTNVPTFSGTAPPLSIVQLFASGAPFAPAIAPPVTADAAGYWTVTAGTVLPAGLNTIYGTITFPGSFQSGSVLLTSITVSNTPPVVRIQPTLKITGELTIVFFGITSSTDTSALLKRNNYALSGPGLAAFHPKSVTAVASSSLREGEMEVILKLPVAQNVVQNQDSQRCRDRSGDRKLK